MTTTSSRRDAAAKRISGDNRTYKVVWADGTGAFETISLEEIPEIVARRYPEAVYADNGETADEPGETELKAAGRVLVWANKADADGPDGNGDDGSAAVAEIVRE